MITAQVEIVSIEEIEVEMLVIEDTRGVCPDLGLDPVNEEVGTHLVLGMRIPIIRIMPLRPLVDMATP